MLRKAIVFIVLLNITVMAQSPTIPPVTDHETVAYRNAQLRLIKAQIALAPDPKWQELQAAQGEINKISNDLITSRKLELGSFGICDGPIEGQEVCKGVKAGELVIRALPKDLAKKVQEVK